MAPIKQHIRVLRDPALDGATNMAIDEAIMREVGAGKQPATLRLYRWSPPALSLGYSQPHSDVNLRALSEHGWDLVRRPTGGRAILHADELTYSFCGAPDGPYFSGGVLESYRRLSRGLVHGLRLLGLAVRVRPAPSQASRNENPVCFEVPGAFELIVSRRKICGSAQVRRKDAVLQHGTLPLEGDLSRIIAVLNIDGPSQSDTARARLLARAATVSDLLGRPLSWEQAAHAVQDGFSSALGVEVVEGELSAGERQLIAGLVAKHQSDAWLQRA